MKKTSGWGCQREAQQKNASNGTNKQTDRQNHEQTENSSITLNDPNINTDAVAFNRVNKEYLLSYS